MRAAYQPDAAVLAPRGEWRGVGALGGANGQTGVFSTRSRRMKKYGLSVVNTGFRPDAVALEGPGSNRRCSVGYLAGGADVTSQVVAGAYRSPVLAPEDALGLTVEIRRRRSSPPGSHITVRVTVASTGDPARVDTVAAQMRGRGR